MTVSEEESMPPVAVKALKSRVCEGPKNEGPKIAKTGGNCLQAMAQSAEKCVAPESSEERVGDAVVPDPCKEAAAHKGMWRKYGEKKIKKRKRFREEAEGDGPTAVR